MSAENLLNSLMMIAMFLMLVSIFIRTEKLPIVQMTWPDHKCIRVKAASEQYNCDNLPRKYILEYVDNFTGGSK